MSCRLLPPAAVRSKAALEQFFVESGIGGGKQLAKSTAPPAGVSIEAPLTNVTAGEQVRIGIRAGDILVSVERPTGLSARNLIAAEITGLRREGAMAILEAVACENRIIPVVVHLTPRAVESLQLKVGEVVWLVLKTHSCHVMRS